MDGLRCYDTKSKTVVIVYTTVKFHLEFLFLPLRTYSTARDRDKKGDTEKYEIYNRQGRS